MLQSGKKNCLVQCNCCDKQFWKLFTFFASVLIKLLRCSCNVFYSCLRTLRYDTSAYGCIVQKTEYVCYATDSVAWQLITSNFARLLANYPALYPINFV